MDQAFNSVNSLPPVYLTDPLLAMLVVVALAAVITRNLLTSTLMLSMFGLLMAVLYLLFGAADVAITEAAIGSGIMTVLMLAAILVTGKKASQGHHLLVPVMVILATAAILIYATLGLPYFADPAAPAHQHLAKEFINRTEADIGVPNIVTAVLASYRGFDTLGEVVVILTGGLSVLMLLKPQSKKKKR